MIINSDALNVTIYEQNTESRTSLFKEAFPIFTGSLLMFSGSTLLIRYLEPNFFLEGQPEAFFFTIASIKTLSIIFLIFTPIIFSKSKTISEFKYTISKLSLGEGLIIFSCYLMTLPLLIH